MGGVVSSEVSVPMEQRINFLKKTPFFILLSEDQLEEFAKCFPSAFKAKAGSTLKLENGIVYVVAEGDLELSTTLPVVPRQKIDTSAYLCKKKPGDIVNQQQTKKEAERRVEQRKLKRFVDDVKTSSCTKSLVLQCKPSLLKEFQSQNPELYVKVDALIKADIDQFLTTLPFLRDVKESQLHVLAAMCRYEAYDSDEMVFEEGTYGSKLYILLDGRVGVFVNSGLMNNNSPSSISSPSARGCCGRSALLQRSLENTVNASVYDIRGRQQQQQEQQHGDGAADPNDGEDGDDGRMAHIASFEKKGDYFGETSLLVNIPRTTSVKTFSKTLFVTVTKMDFENFLKVCPIREAMMNVMKERMLAKLTSLGIPFLVGVSEEKLRSLSRTAEILELEEGDVVFREGEVGDRFYIVVHGEVKVETTAGSTSSEPQGHGEMKDTGIATKNIEKETNDNSKRKQKNIVEVGRLTPGKYFGETALVTDAPRSATITATAKSVILSVEKESFHKIFDKNSQLLAEFELCVLKGNSELIHVLRCESGTAAFRDYLREGMAEENLEFWMAVKRFREIYENCEGGDDAVVSIDEAVKRIYDDYCDPSSDNQVNIPDKMRTDLKKKIDSGEVNANVLDESQAEIYKLMSRDNYSRFKTCEAFKSLCKCTDLDMNSVV